MPSRTGLSHAVAAVAVLVVGPILKQTIELLVTPRDITVAVESVAGLVATHPSVSIDASLVTTALYVAVVGVLAFVWGYAYHVRREATRA